jgi:predicted dehydrogenase
MRVGIVGTGFMGVTHAAGWAETGAEIVGFTSESPAESEQLARAYGAEVFLELPALIDAVDVVDVCTPTHLHYPIVLQAAAARKDIICEKPLARHVPEAQEMVRVCREAGVRLLVAHVVRFFPEYALARAQVASGAIGRPGVLRLTRGSYRPKKPVGNWFLDEAKSGGILMDLMIHDFDYARWVAGEVESVFARKVTTTHPDAPVDYGLAILRHRSGALTHVAGAWAYPPPTFRTGLEIAGERGLIQFDSDVTAPITNLLRRDAGSDAPDVALPASPTSESPYTTQIKEFYAALQNDRLARVTAEDGLAAVQIAVAAMESAASGRAVRLEPLPEMPS